MAIGEAIKDPDSTLDYQLDWEAWLGSADEISSSSWSAESGITVDSDTKTSTTTTVWLSGGTSNNAYEVTNTVTTTGGRTEDRSIKIWVLER